MATTFKHFYYCFMSSKVKREVEMALRSMNIRPGTRWEAVVDLDKSQVDEIAERISKAEHQARIAALRTQKADAAALGRRVAHDLAVRMRTPARQVLVRIEVAL